MSDFVIDAEVDEIIKVTIDMYWKADNVYVLPEYK
jgi:hypothetical protein